MFLPEHTLVKSDLHVAELTPLQINMLTMIKQKKLQLIFGGEKGNG